MEIYIGWSLNYFEEYIKLSNSENITDKMTAMRTLTVFQFVLNRSYTCSIIVHTRAD